MKVPFHLVSKDGSGLPLALKLQAEGHPVTVALQAPTAKLAGKGLVPHRQEPPQGAVVIFDATGLHRQGAKYRAAGHPVIGGNAYEKDLELERNVGARIARKAGMKVPPTFPFSEIKQAVKFLEGLSQDAGWFVKISGDHLESDTNDAPDAESMIRFLEWVEQKYTVHPFVLQQTVPGIEVSCNGWFDGERFVPPFDITFENKKFLTGDKGPRTGCESCVVYHAHGDALAAKTVRLFESVLAEEGYQGTIDVNSLVNREGDPQFLEFSARLGFDSTQAWMRLFSVALGEQLEAFAHGELDVWEPHEVGLSGTLRVSIPPYPEWNEKELGKIQGLPLDYDLVGDPFIDPVDVMEGPAAAGASGVICTVGALGQTVEELPSVLLARAEALEIPNVQYRVDPLAGVAKRMKDLGKLNLLGYSVSAK